MIKRFRERSTARGQAREEPCVVEDSTLPGGAAVDVPSSVALHPLSRVVAAGLRPLDHLCDRVYGSHLNPLYQSGALAIFLLAVTLVTGVYLLCFYTVSAPYASVTRLHEQFFAGRWIRALHRYASDAAMLAIGFHLLRLLAQGRTWGPRAVAWVSGMILTGALLLSGWTGQVMVWDVQAQLLAIEGGKLFDLLPIFSEPVGRAFVSNAALPRSFFFLNLFVHITLPLAAAVLLWIHISRIARPVLVPPKTLAWGILVVLGLFAMVWPPAMLAEADLLQIPTTFAIDWFFCFWLPLARYLPASGQMLFWLLLGTFAFSVPWWLRPRRQDRPAPSYDNTDLCQGCDQCWNDCPFEAIQMVPRPLPRGRASERMAVVNASLCVSCGLCAGSCAPMAIGPPLRTGRMQLQAIPSWFPSQASQGEKVVVLVCRHNDLSHAEWLRQRQNVLLRVTECPGSLHTSVIEHLLRYGAAGVCIVTCPSRNCVNREGPKWLFERLYHQREAELPQRVARQQVCLINAASGERQRVVRELDAFCTRLASHTAAMPGQVDTLIPPASMLTSARQFLPRLLVTVLFLALLTVGNRTPLGHTSTNGVLRLAWRLSDAKIESCRDVTAEELAAKPLHMRQPRECTAQPLRYRLVVRVQAETQLDRIIAPAGARGDRPLYVQQDFPLRAGEYAVEVDFQPLVPESFRQPMSPGDTLLHPPHPLTLQARVEIAPHQITLINYDPQAQALVVVGGRP